MSKTLYILRGVSGSGKSTLAKTLEQALPFAVSYAADDYHYDSEGNYNFKFENLNKAHKHCQSMVEFSMSTCVPNIIVHNTNTSAKETKPYLTMAEKFNYKVVSLVVDNLHGNPSVHNVPQEVCDKQEKRLRNSMKLQ